MAALSLRLIKSHRVLRACSAVALMLAAVLSAAAAQATPTGGERGSAAGEIKGAFSVDNSGAAIYAIPIEMPSGIQRMHPELSLTFNSRLSGGYLGVGWTLQGLPAITRCWGDKNREKGQPTTNVKELGFCLDGQNLVQVPGAGTNGAEYRTLVNNFWRVLSQGDCSGGPCQFSATRPDGTTLNFGLPSHPHAAWVWPVTKVTDANGNFFTVDYAPLEKGSPYEKPYPTIIKYTGNERSGIAPSNQVVLKYDMASFWQENYILGRAYTTSKRLTTIVVSGSGGETRTYDLTYLSATSGQPYDRLRAIRSCSSLEGSQSCLPETVFEWRNGPSGFDSQTWERGKGAWQKMWWHLYARGENSYSSEESGRVLPIAGDFDGDGRTDIAYIYEEEADAGIFEVLKDTLLNNEQYRMVFSIEIHRSDGKNLNPSIWFSQKRDDASDVKKYGGFFMPGRFTGAGSDDLAYVYKDDNGHVAVDVYHADKDNTHFERNGWDVRKKDGETFHPAEKNWSNDVYVLSGDFGGHGKDDLALVGLADGTIDVLVSYREANRDTFVASRWGEVPRAAKVTAGDFNGDGYLDLAALFPGPEGKVAVTTLLSDGKRFVSSGLPFISSINWDVSAEFSARDMNGDGQADIVQSVVNQKGLQPHILYSMASRDPDWAEPRYADVPVHFSSPLAANGALIVGNFNGDHYPDFANVNIGENGGVAVEVAVGRGNGFSTASWLTVPKDSPWAGKAVMVPGDFQGLGRTQVAVLYPSGGWKSPEMNVPQHSGLAIDMLVPAAPGPTQMTKIVTGLGDRIDIEYAPLSDGTVYAPGERGQGLRLGGYFVVSKYTWETASQVEKKTYKYRDAKFDAERLGFLGFASVEIVDEKTKSKKVSHFKQGFPFIGLEWQVETFEGQRLSARLQRYFGCVTGVGGECKSGSGEAGFKGVYQVLLDGEQFEIFGASTDKAVSSSSTLYYYDEFGNVTREYDPSFGGFGASTTLLYTCRGYAPDRSRWILRRLVAEKQSIDERTCFDFDRWRDGKDLRWSRFGYDADGNQTYAKYWLAGSGAAKRGVCESEEEAGGEWACYETTYDKSGNVVSARNPLGHITRISYEPAVITVRGAPASGGAELERKFHHDGWGRITKVVDYNGAVTRHGYDSFGRLREIATTPLAGGAPEATVRTEYRLGTRPGVLAVETRHCPDWGSCRGDGAGWPAVTEESDSAGRLLYTTIAAAGRKPIVMGVTYPEPNKVVLEEPHYEGVSSPSTTMEYDQYGRLLRQTGPDGGRIEFSYNLKGGGAELAVRSLSGHGQTFTAKAGPYGWPAEVVLPGSEKIKYAYDRLGNLTQEIFLGGSRSYKYDTLGRLVSFAASGEGKVDYVHDLAGNLLKEIDAKGQVRQTTYDAFSRPIRRSWGMPGRETAVTFTYDRQEGTNGKGLLTAVEGDGTTYRFAYDHGGRLARQTVVLDGLPGSFDFDWEYDPLGRVIRQVFPDGSAILADYRGGRDLHSLSLVEANAEAPSAYAEFLDYDPFGHARTLIYGNGVSMTYGYDDGGRLRSIKADSGGQKRLDRTIGWDDRSAGQPLGTITAIRDVAAPARSQEFKYDAQGRLNAVTGFGSQAFEFKAGRLERHDRGDNAYRFRYPHQGFQPSGMERNGDLVDMFRYDPNGNLTAEIPNGRPWTTFEYDALNRLKAVRRNSATLGTYRYDVFDRRIMRRDADGTTSWYVGPQYVVTVLPSGEKLRTITVAGPMGPVAEVTRSGAGSLNAAPKAGAADGTQTTAPGASEPAGDPGPAGHLGGAALMVSRRLRTRYGQLFRRSLLALSAAAALVLAGATRAASLSSGELGKGIPTPGVRYFTPGSDGSTLLVTNGEGGQPTARMVYSPYGDLEGSEGIDDFRAKFTGKELDRDTGLYYFGARYFDPRTIRFLTPDPEHQFADPYILAGGRPLTNVDPDGRFATGTPLDVPVLIWRGYQIYMHYQEFQKAGSLHEFLFGGAGGMSLGMAAAINPVPGASPLDVAPFAAGHTPYGTGCVPTSSFPAGTVVKTPGGDIPIENLKVGDMVLARGEAEPQRIAEVLTRTADVLTTITFDGGARVQATPEHPFLTGRGWVAAGELAVEDRLLSITNQEIQVTSVTSSQVKPLQVFNLEVPGPHTYAVSAAGLTVHNAPKRDVEEPRSGLSLTTRMVLHFRTPLQLMQPRTMQLFRNDNFASTLLGTLAGGLESNSRSNAAALGAAIARGMELNSQTIGFVPTPNRFIQIPRYSRGFRNFQPADRSRMILLRQLAEQQQQQRLLTTQLETQLETWVSNKNNSPQCK